MDNCQQPTQEASHFSGQSATTVNLWTLLVVLACTLAVCYALGGNSESEPERVGPAESGVYRVDVNSAGLYELLLLEGVGETTAQKIIVEREASGPYATVDDLQRVKGIGPKTVEKLRPLVRIGARVAGRPEGHGE